ncbi:MAG TPA: M3 family metallopeptidase [Sphingomonas sp.]|nr:M3 family metallopeptidase [Sphingomonas sp.]
MRTLFLATAAATALLPAATVMAQAGAATAAVDAANPAIAPWTGSYGGVPPWDQIKPDQFPAAFTQGIALRRAEYAKIAADPAAPTFANTIVAMQRAGRDLQRVNTLFGVMTSNVTTPAYQALDKQWSPKLAAASDEITFNKPLFQRIEAVYRGRAALDPEQARLTERIYDSFVRQGARLDTAQKAQLGQYNQGLASLFSDFSAKVLADENSFIVVDGEAQLAGLSDSQKASARAAADKRNLAGKWVIVNTRSSVDPFLTFATDRALRERVWLAFKNRGDNGDANDTNALIAQIMKLRSDRARLLGYKTHAHWRMSDTMAKDPEKAMELMLRVWKPTVARVREEVADMQAIATKDGGSITIQPWDYLYYAEKVRKAKYDLDQNELKPYFELNNMIQASYWSAEQLYGITFTEITGKVPVFNPDVRVWEVKDKATGAFRGLFYRDDFASGGKRSGAWANAYRGHETFDGKRTVLSSNNNNFVRGAPGEPVLISLDDAQTLFHEFGHALHALLSEVKYPGLGGTPRDYVEYPSQVNEYWVLTRPVLDRFAKHYKTGAPMPAALLKKVEAAAKFNQGYQTAEYLSSAIVDMKMHLIADGVVDPDKLERQTLAEIGMPRELAMRHRLPQFNHLFSSDAYSAGYYSYLWSDTMAADTGAAFTETGNPYDPAVAAKLRKYILAPGNSSDRAEAYRQFRGRDPDVKALLEKRGFPTN